MTDKQFLLRDNDHKRLLEWNKTFREYPLHKCLHEFIEEQVRKSPDNPAVRFDGEQLSYLEFNNRANRCARYLRSLGIGPDSIVGVIMERSLELPIALTAILKAGGAYLPLDPGYPEERIRFMLEDAGVSVILTQEKFGSIVGDFEGTKFYMDSQWKYISGEQGNDLDNLASSESLAYIIYTSGSTGKPKGVCYRIEPLLTGCYGCRKNIALRRVIGFYRKLLLHLMFRFGNSFGHCFRELALY